MGTQLLGRISAEQEEEPREKEEWVEGYEIGGKKKQEVPKNRILIITRNTFYYNSLCSYE